MRVSASRRVSWESLQTAGADCCVPLGLMSTLIFKIKGKFDLLMSCCLVEAHCNLLLGFPLLRATNYYRRRFYHMVPKWSMKKNNLKKRYKCTR